MTEEQKKENEQKKEYLKSYRKRQRAVKNIERQIEQLRLDEMCPAVRYSDMPGAHNQTDLSDYAGELDKLFEDLRTARYKRIKRCQEITQAIEQMNNEDEQEVLRLKYICGMTWEKVCVEIHYEWAQTHRIHARALQNFQIPGHDTL